MSARTKGWRKDVESGSTDRLLDAAYEAIEAVEGLEAQLKGKYLARKQDVLTAVKVLNSPRRSANVGELFDALRTLVGHAEEPTL